MPDSHYAPQELAQLFHETYERLAPDFGHRTRRDSAKPWAEVPAYSRALMTATCAEVLRAIEERTDQETPGGTTR